MCLYAFHYPIILSCILCLTIFEICHRNLVIRLSLKMIITVFRCLIICLCVWTSLHHCHNVLSVPTNNVPKAGSGVFMLPQYPGSLFRICQLSETRTRCPHVQNLTGTLQKRDHNQDTRVHVNALSVVSKHIKFCQQILRPNPCFQRRERGKKNSYQLC